MKAITGGKHFEGHVFNWWGETTTCLMHCPHFEAGVHITKLEGLWTLKAVGRQLANCQISSKCQSIWKHIEMPLPSLLSYLFQKRYNTCPHVLYPTRRKFFYGGKRNWTCLEKKNFGPLFVTPPLLYLAPGFLGYDREDMVIFLLNWGDEFLPLINHFMLSSTRHRWSWFECASHLCFLCFLRHV